MEHMLPPDRGQPGSHTRVWERSPGRCHICRLCVALCRRKRGEGGVRGKGRLHADVASTSGLTLPTPPRFSFLPWKRVVINSSHGVHPRFPTSLSLRGEAPTREGATLVTGNRTPASGSKARFSIELGVFPLGEEAVLQGGGGERNFQTMGPHFPVNSRLELPLSNQLTLSKLLPTQR